jgi:hypothetical protein
VGSGGGGGGGGGGGHAHVDGILNNSTLEIRTY